MNTALNQDEPSLLHIPMLYNLWKRNQPTGEKTFFRASVNPNWAEEVKLMHALGFGIDEVIRQLLMEKPSFREFEEWIIQRNPGVMNDQTLLPWQNGTTPLQPEQPLADVLTEDDLRFWDENGYFVLPQAVSDTQCDEAAQAIWEFLKFDPAKPETWYQHHPDQRGLMFQFFNHPALQANRISPRIRRAYEQIYQSRDIHVSIDKVSFNPPESGNQKFRGAPLHWDVSLIPPIPLDLQGLLYLHDVTPDQGAFQCVPGFHKKIDHWLQNLPEGINPREQILNEVSPISIGGKKGDFIIWHQALPHCASPNHTTQPRLVQYLTWHLNNRVVAENWR